MNTSFGKENIRLRVSDFLNLKNKNDGSTFERGPNVYIMVTGTEEVII